jgi:hypothetical protein
LLRGAAAVRDGEVDASLGCPHAHHCFRQWFEQTYTATHIIYVISRYRFRLDQPLPTALLQPEIRCVRDAIPLGISIRNADLVGECVDTLHMCGIDAEDDIILRAGVAFLLNSQQADGSWSCRHGVVTYSALDPDAHHATFVCMWALLSSPFNKGEGAIHSGKEPCEVSFMTP